MSDIRRSYGDVSLCNSLIAILYSDYTYLRLGIAGKKKIIRRSVFLVRSVVCESYLSAAAAELAQANLSRYKGRDCGQSGQPRRVSPPRLS